MNNENSTSHNTGSSIQEYDAMVTKAKFQSKQTWNDNGPICVNWYENFGDALTAAGQAKLAPRVIDHIIINLRSNIVQVMKGDISPFVPGLNANHPGWQEGVIYDFDA